MSGTRHYPIPSTSLRGTTKVWIPSERPPEPADERERSRQPHTPAPEPSNSRHRNPSRAYQPDPSSRTATSSGAAAPPAAQSHRAQSSRDAPAPAHSSSRQHVPRAATGTPMSQPHATPAGPFLDVPDPRAHVSRRTHSKSTPMSSTEHISSAEDSSRSSHQVPVRTSTVPTYAGAPIPMSAAQAAAWNAYEQQKASSSSRARDAARDDRAKRKEQEKDERQKLKKEEAARQERAKEDKARSDHFYSQSYAKAKAAEVLAKVTKVGRASSKMSRREREDKPQEYYSSDSARKPTVPSTSLRHRPTHDEAGAAPSHSRSKSLTAQPSASMLAYANAAQVAYHPSAQRSAATPLPVPSTSHPHAQTATTTIQPTSRPVEPQTSAAVPTAASQAAYTSSGQRSTPHPSSAPPQQAYFTQTSGAATPSVHAVAASTPAEKPRRTTTRDVPTPAPAYQTEPLAAPAPSAAAAYAAAYTASEAHRAPSGNAEPAPSQRQVYVTAQYQPGSVPRAATVRSTGGDSLPRGAEQIAATRPSLPAHHHSSGSVSQQQHVSSSATQREAQARMSVYQTATSNQPSSGAGTRSASVQPQGPYQDARTSVYQSLGATHVMARPSSGHGHRSSSAHPQTQHAEPRSASSQQPRDGYQPDPANASLPPQAHPEPPRSASTKPQQYYPEHRSAAVQPSGSQADQRHASVQPQAQYVEQRSASAQPQAPYADSRAALVQPQTHYPDQRSTSVQPQPTQTQYHDARTASVQPQVPYLDRRMSTYQGAPAGQATQQSTGMGQRSAYVQPTAPYTESRSADPRSAGLSQMPTQGYHADPRASVYQSGQPSSANAGPGAAAAAAQPPRQAEPRHTERNPDPRIASTQQQTEPRIHDSRGASTQQPHRPDRNTPTQPHPQQPDPRSAAERRMSTYQAGSSNQTGEAPYLGYTSTSQSQPRPSHSRASIYQAATPGYPTAQQPSGLSGQRTENPQPQYPNARTSLYQGPTSAQPSTQPPPQPPSEVRQPPAQHSSARMSVYETVAASKPVHLASSPLEHRSAPVQPHIGHPSTAQTSTTKPTSHHPESVQRSAPHKQGPEAAFSYHGNSSTQLPEDRPSTDPIPRSNSTQPTVTAQYLVPQLVAKQHSASSQSTVIKGGSKHGATPTISEERNDTPPPAPKMFPMYLPQGEVDKSAAEKDVLSRGKEVAQEKNRAQEKHRAQKKAREIERDGAGGRESDREKERDRGWERDVDREKDKENGREKDRERGKEKHHDRERRDKERPSRSSHRSHRDRAPSLPVNQLNATGMSGSETEPSIRKESKHHRTASHPTSSSVQMGLPIPNPTLDISPPEYRKGNVALDYATDGTQGYESSQRSKREQAGRVIDHVPTSPRASERLPYSSPPGQMRALPNPELLLQLPWDRPTPHVVSIHAGQGPPDRGASRASQRPTTAPLPEPSVVPSRVGHSTSHQNVRPDTVQRMHTAPASQSSMHPNPASLPVPIPQRPHVAESPLLSQPQPQPLPGTHAGMYHRSTNERHEPSTASMMLSPISIGAHQITPTHSNSSNAPRSDFLAPSGSQSHWSSMPQPVSISRNPSGNSQTTASMAATPAPAQQPSSSVYTFLTSNQNTPTTSTTPKPTHAGAASAQPVQIQAHPHHSTALNVSSRHDFQLSHMHLPSQDRYPQSSSYPSASQSSQNANPAFAHDIHSSTVIAHTQPSQLSSAYQTTGIGAAAQQNSASTITSVPRAASSGHHRQGHDSPQGRDGDMAPATPPTPRPSIRDTPVSHRSQPVEVVSRSGTTPQPQSYPSVATQLPPLSVPAQYYTSSAGPTASRFPSAHDSPPRNTDIVPPTPQTSTRDMGQGSFHRGPALTRSQTHTGQTQPSNSSVATRYSNMPPTVQGPASVLSPPPAAPRSFSQPITMNPNRPPITPATAPASFSKNSVTATRVPISGIPSTPASTGRSNLSQTVPPLTLSSSPDSYEEVLMTPSSLAPTLKGVQPQQQFPVMIEKQEEPKKKGLFGIFRSSSRAAKTKDQEPWEATSGPSQRRESTSKPGYRSSSAPPSYVEPPIRPNKISKPPPIKPLAAPAPVSASQQQNALKGINFKLFTSKRHRTVSYASVEALDGTANNTVVGSPRSSVRNSTAGRITPPLRDPFSATQDWRNNEEQEWLDRGNRRRRRPGVTFDVAADDIPPVSDRGARLVRSSRSITRDHE